ncbi:MAG: MoaD/ThiS family protein, partial [Candidatus Bathyarchaeia archaeon]
MAKVTILFLGHLKDLVKTEKLEVNIRDGMTIKNLLEEKLSNFSELKNELLVNEERHLVNIIINGKNIYSLNGLNTNLKDKDT